MGAWSQFAAPSAPASPPEWLESQEDEGTPVEGSNGRWYIVDSTGKVISGPMSREACMYAFGWEGPRCSLCDGLGHGYPGGGFCPLEDRGAYEPEERW
jgi:hypothetical protein